MKYSVTIGDIELVQDGINKVDVILTQKSVDNYANEKNRVEIFVEAYIFENDKTLYNLLNMKEEYIEVKLKSEDLEYIFPKMYIYSIKQNYTNGSGIFYLTMYQKFIGNEKELIINENTN